MTRNYWHIQLHPSNQKEIDIKKVKSILKDKRIIGMGESWTNRNHQEVIDPYQFRDEVKEGSIVMVRQGSTPVALVEVVSDWYVVNEVDDNFDWFALRRDIKVLDFFGNDEGLLLKNILQSYKKSNIQASGTLTACRGSNATNDFIKQWHKHYQYKNIMKNNNLSSDQKKQLKALWNNFKESYKEEEIRNKGEALRKLLNQWKEYKELFKNNGEKFELNHYTNRLINPPTLPGGYLCNFLERTTSVGLGSSKPGSAHNFGVKMNNNRKTYWIKEGRKDVGEKEAQTYFNNNIKNLFVSIANEQDLNKKIERVDKANYSAKQILMKFAVMDNIQDFIFIYLSEYIDNLYDEFIGSDEVGTFVKNHHLSIVLRETLGFKRIESHDLTTCSAKELGLIVLSSNFLWELANSSFITDKNNPNVILYGAPGTGKTYSVMQSLNFVCRGDHSKYEMLQFHPSFTYEDFIEGIKPKGVTKEGNIRFELVNGVFKNFCIRAKSDPTNDYYFVVDEINRANLSSVFGETLSLLEKDYRHTPGGNRNLIKTQYSTLIETLINESPDESKEYKKLAYDIDENGEVRFGIPENIYFVGMMNDVDKSIDTFDLALRRRFKWIRKSCDYDVIEQFTTYKGGIESFDNIEQYITACKKINNYISNDLGMGKSYEFGHSYFMKMKNIAGRKTITEENIETLFNQYLLPTLNEYLRVVYSEGELDEKISEILEQFKNPIK